MLITLGDATRASFVAEDVDGVRLSSSGRRLYVLSGCTSNVITYSTPELADGAFSRVSKALDNTFHMGDIEPAVVRLDSVTGFRLGFEPLQLVVVLSSFSLICRYADGEGMETAFDQLTEALSGPLED